MFHAPQSFLEGEALKCRIPLTPLILRTPFYILPVPNARPQAYDKSAKERRACLNGGGRLSPEQDPLQRAVRVCRWRADGGDSEIFERASIWARRDDLHGLD